MGGGGSGFEQIHKPSLTGPPCGRPAPVAGHCADLAVAGPRPGRPRAGRRKICVKPGKM